MSDRNPGDMCTEMQHAPWSEVTSEDGERRMLTCFCGEMRYEVVWQSPVDLQHTTDALIWAREFRAHLLKDPTLGTDEGRLVGWFAAAIEAGKNA